MTQKEKKNQHDKTCSAEMDRELHKDRLKFTVKDKDILHFVNKNTYLMG